MVLIIFRSRVVRLQSERTGIKKNSKSDSILCFLVISIRVGLVVLEVQHVIINGGMRALISTCLAVEGNKPIKTSVKPSPGQEKNFVFLTFEQEKLFKLNRKRLSYIGLTWDHWGGFSKVKKDGVLRRRPVVVRSTFITEFTKNRRLLVIIVGGSIGWHWMAGTGNFVYISPFYLHNHYGKYAGKLGTIYERCIDNFRCGQSLDTVGNSTYKIIEPNLAHVLIKYPITRLIECITDDTTTRERKALATGEYGQRLLSVLHNEKDEYDRSMKTDVRCVS
jgi:hypothetical protein